MRRILVVDDEPDITSGILGCLQDRFRVDAFNDPLEALSNFQQGMYDMVLIDIKMPKMNGFELYKAMYGIDPEAGYCFITAFEIR
ncbi:MAG TPA: response regulator, partial [Nitrososphaera sp.]|nr:response regulator [Nitrososphaera sp.]